MSLQFVHIPKNAGSSLRASFKQFDFELYRDHEDAVDLNRKVVHESLRQDGLRCTLNHVRYRDLNQKWLKDHKSGQFAIVRNPWSREYSKYKFLFTSKQRNGDLNKRGDLMKKFRKGKELTFEEYLFDVADHYKDKPFMWLHACETFYPQLDYVIDDLGEVACDILRFENYEEDVSSYLNIDPKNLKHVNNQGIDSYQHAYNDKLIQRVADLYQRDIGQWGFDFDTGATKNYWSK